MQYELIMPKINEMSIHHIVVYECNTNYNGTPAISNRYCYADVTTSLCEKASFAYDHLIYKSQGYYSNIKPWTLTIFNISTQKIDLNIKKFENLFE